MKQPIRMAWLEAITYHWSPPVLEQMLNVSSRHSCRVGGFAWTQLHGLTARLLLFLLRLLNVRPFRNMETNQPLSGKFITLDLFHPERIINSSLLALTHIQSIFYMTLSFLFAGLQPGKLTESLKSNWSTKSRCYKISHQTLQQWQYSCGHMVIASTIFVHITWPRSLRSNELMEQLLRVLLSCEFGNYTSKDWRKECLSPGHSK